MIIRSLTVLSFASLVATSVAAQDTRDRCDEDSFALTAQECLDYGGVVDGPAGECRLSNDIREQAREEICLGLPDGGGTVTNFAPIAGPLLGVVALAGLAGGGGSTSSTSTTSTTD